MFKQTRILGYSAIAIAITAALATGSLHAQATSGRIVGQVPLAADETVLIEGNNGVVREVAVDGKGRYAAEALPLASYTVTLRRDGKAVDSHSGVTLQVGVATEVSFTAEANAQQLGTIAVTANALPPIDVSSTSSSTIITAAQMARLPLQRTAEGIALLAPGASPGSSHFSGAFGNGLVSFSGSSVTENAYYINGFNTTDPLSGYGGVSLPYGAIDQEEVLSGGYSAAYGRSDGGVISQVGKRGTNEWHFGAQLLWEPAFARDDAANIYWVNGTQAGKIYQRNSADKQWTTTASAYLGGPLIKDKLYLFTAVEAERQQGNNVGSTDSPYDTTYRYMNPKWYAKLDWNITDSNILELTGVSQKRRYEGSKYNYDYLDDSRGSFANYDTTTKTAADIYIAKYTSYITDDLTLTATYGKSKMTYYNQTPGVDTSQPFIGGINSQNPALDGGTPIPGLQTQDTVSNPDHRSTNINLRFDLTYHIGDHTITAGIDNQNSKDIDDGVTIGGAGYELYYAHGDAGKNIGDNPFIDAPGNYPGGQTGYYYYTRNYRTSASVRVRQHAQYLEDKWQVSDRLLLQLGLRNDQFTNYNPEGQPYLRLGKPQWAPRLGFSWDVHGDSSLKVYGNAGRYYLDMPASVALRTAAGSLATQQYFTYTGIDANGLPTGATLINNALGGAPISSNNQYGQAPDPRTVAAKNIKSEYQDEFILGFDQQLSPDWVWGMKGTVRRLKNALDDICDSQAIDQAAINQGFDPSQLTVGSCYLSNPGRANVYDLAAAGGGYDAVKVTNADFGFPHLKRNYYGLETYLSHPFDGTWSARVDYLYSRSYGNSEGQVRSDLGQLDVAASRDWDYPELMYYANGYLPNDRKHQLKIYGSYQLTPEWMVSANATIQSGTPRECLGYFGPDQTDPDSYGSYYHYCGGKPSRPGDAGRNPWEELIDVNAEYRPDWANHKLAFNVTVFNLLNQQRAEQIGPVYGTNTTVQNGYKLVAYYTQPRYMRFGITYDF